MVPPFPFAAPSIAVLMSLISLSLASHLSSRLLSSSSLLCNSLPMFRAGADTGGRTTIYYTLQHGCRFSHAGAFSVKKVNSFHSQSCMVLHGSEYVLSFATTSSSDSLAKYSLVGIQIMPISSCFWRSFLLICQTDLPCKGISMLLIVTVRSVLSTVY